MLPFQQVCSSMDPQEKNSSLDSSGSELPNRQSTDMYISSSRSRHTANPTNQPDVVDPVLKRLGCFNVEFCLEAHEKILSF